MCALKVPCHAFPVITRPLVCYEGFYACKRSAESQTLKVHPVASKTLTQKIPPQNASLEIRHCPFDSSGYRLMSCGTRNEMDQSRRAMATPAASCSSSRGSKNRHFTDESFQNIAQFEAGYAQLVWTVWSRGRSGYTTCKFALLFVYLSNKTV